MPHAIDHTQLYKAGLSTTQAGEIATAVNKVFSDFSHFPGEVKDKALRIWSKIRKEVITPIMPLEAKRLLCDAAFEGWDEDKWGPRPLWQATADQLKSTNIQAVMNAHGFHSDDELYQWSIKHGQDFWKEMVERVGIKFKAPYKELVDTSNPKAPKWFPGAKLNIADSLFQADPDATAILYQKEGAHQLRKVSYRELDELSNKVANGLVKQGYKPGDCIALAMPFNVEAIAAYIGMMKAGCTVLCLADGLQPPLLKVLLKQIPDGVKGIFTQDFSGGAAKKHPLYQVVADTENAPRAIVMCSDAEPMKMKRDGDIAWNDFLQGASEKFTSVPCDPEQNINVIFSSSTTTHKEQKGEEPKPPKAICWKANTACKSAIDAYLHHNMQPGKVLNWQTNMGWMMGPFGVFGSLMNKGTYAMFDGDVSSQEFGEFIEKARPNILGTTPRVEKMWQQSRCLEGRDLSSVELFSSTSSASTPANYFYLMSLVPGFAPVMEYCGGTEVGGGYISGTLHRPGSPAMFTMPTFGTELAFPADTGHPDFEDNEMAIVMRTGNGATPPMGLSTQLLNGNNEEKYFPQNATTADGHPLRKHGDLIMRKPGGFMRHVGRTDDLIKINGIGTTSEQLEGFIHEAALQGKIPGLTEVVIGRATPPEGGEDIVVAFAVMEEGSTLRGAALHRALQNAIKDNNARIARIDAVKVIDSVNRTLSNKTKRTWMVDAWMEEQLELKKSGQGFFAEASAIARE